MATWSVTMSRNVGGKPDVITRDNIQAANQQEAVRKAMQGIPNAQQYTNVQAMPMDQAGQGGQQQAGPNQGQTPNAQPNQTYGGQFHPQAMRESVHFPYTVNLPLSYAPIVAEAKIENVVVSKKNGRLCIIVPRPQDLQLFLRKLTEQALPKAKKLVEGIVKSFKR